MTVPYKIITWSTHTVEPSYQIEIVMLRLCNVSDCPSELMQINCKKKSIMPLDHFIDHANKSNLQLLRDFFQNKNKHF